MLRGRLQSYLLSAGLAGFLAGVSMSNTRPAFAYARQDPVAPQNAGASTTTSVLDGVFTVEQATRGRQMFQRVCSSCHTVAEHTGRKFEVRWAGSSLGEMFEGISNTMPEGNPGSLKPDEYASIIAFVLKETGYPAGEHELPAHTAALRTIRIEPLAAK